MAAWWQFLVCPTCKGRLTAEERGYSCAACSCHYPLVRGLPRFLDPVRQAEIHQSPDGDAMVRAYRAPNRILQALRTLITSEYFPGKAWRAAKAEAAGAPGPLLVIGSGVTTYPDAIQLDIDDFHGVNLVADAHDLPLETGAVGSVICETVLEHVYQPARVIAEAARVLRPGGRFFFIVPFVFPFHGHPNDYQRWTQEGLRLAFSEFQSVTVGIHGGPSSAMVNLLSEWGYVLSGCAFPKGYVPIKGTLTALLMPLKFLDFFANRFPEAHRLAATLYVTGIR